MNTIDLRLIFNVQIAPYGVSAENLKDKLKQIIEDALDNGTVTGNTPACVIRHFITVEQIR